MRNSEKIISTAKAENLATNADGELPVLELFELELPLGTYYVKETRASKGYKLDACNEGDDGT